MKNRMSYLIIVAWFLLLSVMFVFAADATPSSSENHNKTPAIDWSQSPAATVVKDGEHVLTTTDGKMYVSKDAKFKHGFIWLHKVRYPFEMETLLIPTTRVHDFYIKGFIRKE